MPTTRLFPALLLALALIGTAFALLVANPASAVVSWSVSPAIVHPTTSVVVSGGKDPGSTLEVELRSPGSGWIPVTSSCSGTAEGSAVWSCALGSGRALGNFGVKVTEAGPAVLSTSTGAFVVVPDAVGKNATVTPPPPPAPEPDPEPTATPTPIGAKPTTVPVPPAAPSTTNGPASTPTGAEISGQQLTTQSLQESADESEITAAGPVPLTAQRAFSTGTAESTSRNDPGAPSVLGHRLPTLHDLAEHPLSLLAAGGIGSLILLLIALPANFLDDTIEANSHRFRKWMSPLAPLAKRLAALRARLPRVPAPGVVALVLSSIAFGFADPEFGFDLTSLRLTMSLALGLLLVIYLPNAITRAVMGRRFGVNAQVVVLPGALVVGVIGVLASRLLGFNPGLLIGLLVGLELAAGARSLDHRRAVTLRMVSILVVSLLAWLGYVWFEAATTNGDIGFVGALLSETLVAATTEGLTGLVVALLPISYLDGKMLFATAKRWWVAIALPTAIAFALLVLPTAISDDGPIAPLWLWVVVFASFTALVAAVWVAFRLLERREARAAQPVG